MIRSDSQDTRAQAARTVAAGGVIAFRTDTFYGLGADPLNPDAVRKIRDLKGREDDKPILVLISDLSEIDRFTIEPSNKLAANEASDGNSVFRTAIQLFWPGPLTLVIRARADLPAELTAGTDTIGLRLPADEQVRTLVRTCGGALTATSANVSGQPPAFSAVDVESYFPEGLELIIDGGYAISTEPSTVVDVTTPQPRVIRRGVITEAELAPIFAVGSGQ